MAESKKLKKSILSKSREKTFRGPQYFFTGQTPEDRRTDQNTETSNTSHSFASGLNMMQCLQLAHNENAQ